jgi:hypothetical protein
MGQQGPGPYREALTGEATGRSFWTGERQDADGCSGRPNLEEKQNSEGRKGSVGILAAHARGCTATDVAAEMLLLRSQLGSEPQR